MDKKTKVATIEVERHIHEEWVAVSGPTFCVCGHEHYARQQFINGQMTILAPQSDKCEDRDCGCTSLRPSSSR